MKKYITTGTLGIAAIICFALISSAYKYKFTSTETISVTGLAEKNFTSDLIVWSGSYSRKNMVLQTAYEQLKADETAIHEYLKTKGVKDEDVVFSAVDIQKDFDYHYDNNGNQTGTVFTGFDLTQYVTVKSKEIDRIEQLSREVTELIESGIEFNSNPPAYYYTKLSELKLDLLANAATDANKRAVTIAKNSGGHLGSLVKANMGVFQITGENSDEDYSYGGAFNTSSKNKTASITIKTEYKIK